MYSKHFVICESNVSRDQLGIITDISFTVRNDDDVDDDVMFRFRFILILWYVGRRYPQ